MYLILFRKLKEFIDKYLYKLLNKPEYHFLGINNQIFRIFYNKDDINTLIGSFYNIYHLFHK